MKIYLLPFIVAFCLAFTACTNNGTSSGTNNPNSEPAPAILNYTLLNAHPHDTSFFTEGLEFNEGKLFESSGGQEEETPHPSAFGVLDLKTGKVDKKVELDNAIYFGEGITIFNGKIYQLTWKNQKGFIYDAKTYKKIKEFDYQGDGWGLTHDSSRLIMSNGSSNLKFLDPETLKVMTIVSVVDNNGPVSNINELEFIDGYVYANVWQRDHILKIDPSSGKVVGRINLDSLVREVRSKSATADVLNGIAYNPLTKTIFVTGKLWPLIYEIRVN
jgi:glutaminyl-peptide cyclotransferase